MVTGADVHSEYPQKESKSSLADQLFCEAHINKSEEYLERAEKDLLRGAQEEQLKESLKRFESNFTQALMREISPNLSEAENKERLALKQKKYDIADGDIAINMLDEESERRLRFLDKKAYN